MGDREVDGQNANVPRPVIVVGIDGSASSRNALRWAKDEARMRGASLRLIHSWELPTISGAIEPNVPRASLTERAERVLSEATEAVPGCAELDITSEIAASLPARALIEASNDADLVVVGSRGVGGFKGLLLGSVAQQVSHHSECPVVIVRSSAHASE